MPGRPRNGRVECPLRAIVRRREYRRHHGHHQRQARDRPVGAGRRGGEERRRRTIVTFAHHKGSRACGTFSEEDVAAVQRGRHGPVERLGEAQVPGAGSYVFHGRYVPDQFGGRDGSGLSPKGTGRRHRARVRRGHPEDRLRPALDRCLGVGSMFASGIYSFGTPHRVRPRGRASELLRGRHLGLRRRHPAREQARGPAWWIGPTTFASRAETDAGTAVPKL